MSDSEKMIAAKQAEELRRELAGIGIKAYPHPRAAVVLSLDTDGARALTDIIATEWERRFGDKGRHT